MCPFQQATSEAARLTNKDYSWRDTFWNDILIQGRPLPLEKTGKHTSSANREHQPWLKCSPQDCPLCSPAYRLLWVSENQGQGGTISVPTHTQPRTQDTGRACSVCVPRQWPASTAQVPSFLFYLMLSPLSTSLTLSSLSSLPISFIPWRTLSLTLS